MTKGAGHSSLATTPTFWQQGTGSNNLHRYLTTGSPGKDEEAKEYMKEGNSEEK